MINQAIGASGVVSKECKAVVEQYGQMLLDLLLAEVSNWSTFVHNFFFNGVYWLICLFTSCPHFGHSYFICQATPKKVCSQMGLCTFDGTRGVRSGSQDSLSLLSYGVLDPILL